MRIGIEAQRIFRKDKHGMDYVVLQEIRELQRMDTRHEYFVFVAPGDDRCLQESANVHIIETGGGFYPLWEQFSLPRAAKKCKVDLLHCTSNTAPLWCRIPLMLTLHDIIFLEKRDKQNKSLYQNMGRLYRRLVVPRIVKKCRRIITVSDFERQNILSNLKNVTAEQLVRIYNGFNGEFLQAGDKGDAFKKYIDEAGYFFHFANTDPRKNTTRTLMAYAQYLTASAKKLKLLLTGISREYLDSLLEKNGLQHLNSQLVLTGYIPSSDLPSIYANAFALLFVSLREGFGIPILEAMASGIPVITSSASSMPEVGGPEGIFVNPEDTDAIVGSMLTLENDAKLYQHQVEYGLQRAPLFSWHTTATQLLALYEQVLQIT